MKNKILQVIKFVQENQSGLFKIAVLLILLYWTQIFRDIAKDINYFSLTGVETELGTISDKLADIDLTLTNR